MVEVLCLITTVVAASSKGDVFLFVVQKRLFEVDGIIVCMDLNLIILSVYNK